MSAKPTPPPTLPSLSTLYWNDRAFSRWAKAACFSLVVAAGMYWATRPVPGALVTENTAFDAEVGKMVPPIAIAVAVVALVLLILRYLTVKRTFTQGIIIKGLVEDIEVYSREQDTDRTAGQKRSYVRTYWATLVYNFGGKERRVKLKLPNSGFTFGLVKGSETDILVLESRPDRPLIRAVYLKRS